MGNKSSRYEWDYKSQYEWDDDPDEYSDDEVKKVICKCQQCQTVVNISPEDTLNHKCIRCVITSNSEESIILYDHNART